MFTLTINGKQYTYEQDRRLLDILRNDLGQNRSKMVARKAPVVPARY